jgi:hypothetical protein
MDDWNDYKTKREIDNMKKSAMLSRKLSHTLVILGFGAVNGLLLVRISQELDIMPGPLEKRLPMLSSYFPYDYKLSPAFEITWFLQYIVSGLSTIVFSGIYCLFVSLVLHLQAQITNLRFNIENLKNLTRDHRQINAMELKKTIGCIIERHVCLNRFVSIIYIVI